MVAPTWITPGCVQFLKNKKRFHTAWTRSRHGDFADYRAALLVELIEANGCHPLQISPLLSSAAQPL
jgi:hypothetical protein